MMCPDCGKPLDALLLALCQDCHRTAEAIYPGGAEARLRSLTKHGATS